MTLLPMATARRVLCTDPAGSLVIHHQSILHSRAPVLEGGHPRHMLKFIFYRSTPPTTTPSPFHPAGPLRAGGFSRGAAALACWLAGAENADIGGQGSLLAIRTPRFCF